MPVPAVPQDAPLVSSTPVLRFRDRVRQRSGQRNLLVVRVGQERFALPVDAIVELVEEPHPRPVPRSGPAHLGVFALGDRLLSLYDPAAILGTPLQAAPVALVMRSGARLLALAVDDADDVVTVDLADVRDAPRVAADDELVLGVLWRPPDLITVLDARAVGAACAAIGEGAA